MAWNKVSEKTICKCFSHGGFLQLDEKTYAVVEELEKIISALTNMTAQDFKAWMDIDEDLENSASLIDYSIHEVVSNTKEISVSVFDKDEHENVI